MNLLSLVLTFFFLGLVLGKKYGQGTAEASAEKAITRAETSPRRARPAVAQGIRGPRGQIHPGQGLDVGRWSASGRI